MPTFNVTVCGQTQHGCPAHNREDAIDRVIPLLGLPPGSYEVTVMNSCTCIGIVYTVVIG